MAQIYKRGLIPALVAIAVLGGAAYYGLASLHRPTSNHIMASPPSPQTITVVAVGDIFSDQSSEAPKATADLVDEIDPLAIIGLGDYQYTTGSCDNFLDSGHYDSVWGRENRRLYPVFGPSHDYNALTANAAGYMSHECAGQKAPAAAGAAAGSGHMSWDMPYSYDLGSWHLIALPSLCFDFKPACNPDLITDWLKADLKAHNARCTIAYMHEPYWTSPTPAHNRQLGTKPWVQLLYDHGVEMLLTGHQHYYERFYPQNPADQRDDQNGIQAFTVGTGGMTHYQKTSTAQGEAAYDDDTFGVLKLELGDGKYSWQFMPAAGGSYTDSGSATCH